MRYDLPKMKADPTIAAQVARKVAAVRTNEQGLSVAAPSGDERTRHIEEVRQKLLETMREAYDKTGGWKGHMRKRKAVREIAQWALETRALVYKNVLMMHKMPLMYQSEYDSLKLD